MIFSCEDWRLCPLGALGASGFSDLGSLPRVGGSAAINAATRRVWPKTVPGTDEPRSPAAPGVPACRQSLSEGAGHPAATESRGEFTKPVLFVSKTRVDMNLIPTWV